MKKDITNEKTKDAEKHIKLKPIKQKLDKFKKFTNYEIGITVYGKP